MMRINARALAKRLLPGSRPRRIAKRVWERVKRQRDRSAFKAVWPDAAFVYLSHAEIHALRARGYRGQVAQDYFLDLLFDGRTGRFADIGANNPEANSNSWFLERKGWSGYAIDPMRSLAGKWSVRPATRFINAAISDRRETREFVEIIPKAGWEHQLSAFREFVRDEDLRDYEHRSYPVECAPLSDFVAADERLDLVSIDVEGAEGLILAGLDFASNPPAAIVMENVSRIGGENSHRRQLCDRGYVLVARLNMSDDLFVHRSLPLPRAFEEALTARAI